ncbi:hypothetical protein [Streptomyces sp. NPDC002692]
MTTPDRTDGPVICTRGLTDTILTPAARQARTVQGAGELLAAFSEAFRGQFQQFSKIMMETLASIGTAHRHLRESGHIDDPATPARRPDRPAWQSSHGPAGRRVYRQTPPPTLHTRRR